MDGLYDKQFAMIQKSLDYRFQRQNLLAANVANVETPGYQAKDIVFEKALGAAMHAQEPGPLKVTNKRHLDGRSAQPMELVKPVTIRSANPLGSLDGNSVDLEREMAKLADNQIAFSTLTRILTERFRTLKMAIGEGEP